MESLNNFDLKIFCWNSSHFLCFSPQVKYNICILNFNIPMDICIQFKFFFLNCLLLLLFLSCCCNLMCVSRKRKQAIHSCFEVYILQLDDTTHLRNSKNITKPKPCYLYFQRLGKMGLKQPVKTEFVHWSQNIPLILYDCMYTFPHDKKKKKKIC